jgi:hypothetical protein
MIKWGTFGQQIWGTHGQFKKNYFEYRKFYTFSISFRKKIVLDMTVDPMTARIFGAIGLFFF